MRLLTTCLLLTSFTAYARPWTVIEDRYGGVRIEFAQYTPSDKIAGDVLLTPSGPAFDAGGTAVAAPSGLIRRPFSEKPKNRIYLNVIQAGARPLQHIPGAMMDALKQAEARNWKQVVIEPITQGAGGEPVTPYESARLTMEAIQTFVEGKGHLSSIVVGATPQMIQDKQVAKEFQLGLRAASRTYDSKWLKVAVEFMNSGDPRLQPIGWDAISNMYLHSPGNDRVKRAMADLMMNEGYLRSQNESPKVCEPSFLRIAK